MSNYSVVDSIRYNPSEIVNNTTNLTSVLREFNDNDVCVHISTIICGVTFALVLILALGFLGCVYNQTAQQAHTRTQNRVRYIVLPNPGAVGPSPIPASSGEAAEIIPLTMEPIF
jgi:hypothetical protein